MGTLYEGRIAINIDYCGYLLEPSACVSTSLERQIPWGRGADAFEAINAIDREKGKVHCMASDSGDHGAASRKCGFCVCAPLRLLPSYLPSSPIDLNSLRLESTY
jgi:hypothetical protein